MSRPKEAMLHRPKMVPTTTIVVQATMRSRISVGVHHLHVLIDLPSVMRSSSIVIVSCM